MGLDITEQEGTDFVIRIMDTINSMNSEEEKFWGDGRRFNLELIPGEQAAIKICEADKMIFPSFPNPYILYSNQFIPLIDRSDVYTRMKLQGQFDSRAQGGCIMHINLDHRLNNSAQMTRLIESAARAGALYFAVNFNIAWCENSHVNVGSGITTCNACGGKIVRNLTRVVGFITDVSDWHQVRRWEYTKRHFYQPDEAVSSEIVQEVVATA
jgi:anaerobic ribonucleoside-triphosphate reductase